MSIVDSTRPAVKHVFETYGTFEVQSNFVGGVKAEGALVSLSKQTNGLYTPNSREISPLLLSFCPNTACDGQVCLGPKPGTKAKSEAGGSALPSPIQEPGLGSLEKLPPELRRDILEIVLEIDQPIGTRMCCGILSSKEGCCLFHQQFLLVSRAHKVDRTRFAPLIVSRPLRHDALWVLHSKMKLCADVSTLMLVNKKRASIPYERKYFNHMWRSISQFRHIELVVPAPKNSAYCKEHTECLLSILCQFFEYWEKQDKPGTPDPAREVTIHLGVLFNAPRQRTRWDTAQTLLENPYLDNLEQAVELIVVKDWNVKFKFTAMSEISEDREYGNKAFVAFIKLLGNVGIDFEGKTLAEASVGTIAFRGALGGTHSRFID